MENSDFRSLFHSGNLGLLEEYYLLYQRNPALLSPEWRSFYQDLSGNLQKGILETGALPGLFPESSIPRNSPGEESIRLREEYRSYGHLRARLDPLQDSREAITPPFLPAGKNSIDEKEIRLLQERYSSTTGFELDQIHDGERREFLFSRIEDPAFLSTPSIESRLEIFRRLYSSENFERFLAIQYPGKHRFSLEGAESLIVALEEIVQLSPSTGISEIVLGMAHRGRLNVLYNILRKDPTLIFAEFNEERPAFFVQGDVKYHMGFSADRFLPTGEKLHISMAFNPSHLESVNPVVLGSARHRRETKTGRAEAEKGDVLPLLVHGDAAFVGQGVNQESLNLSGLSGYETGGTIHIVLNNQIGFTTEPREGRSSRYATDPARMLSLPVFHVNGDDPEAVCRTVRLAMEWRRRYAADVFIDLICYRRPGHNETDDPSLTQPLLYRKIADHPTTAALYEERLKREDVDPLAIDAIKESSYNDLKEGFEKQQRGHTKIQVQSMEGRWSSMKRFDRAMPPSTGFPLEKLREIGAHLTNVPKGFQLHETVKRLLSRRRETLEKGTALDWGVVELLAYGSLLLDGIPVRIAGQDAVRGTFSHRHAAWFDAASGERYTPLQDSSHFTAPFQIHNSPLSEAATLGFEYGYSLVDPHQLVVWEAQFGDFANGAQVVLDQFLSSGEAKWGRMSGLVLYLPHGYEGMGPEHSSARLERFLQLCAMNNMQTVVPTTPAQLFHLLRRQLLRNFRKPLVIFTPKSLLRHPEAVSAMQELSDGSFHTVLDDDDSAIEPERVERIIYCSGKIYYDLEKARRERETRTVALVRVEELYPWPQEGIIRNINKYPGAKQIFWVQEEPMNQGAWPYVRGRLPHFLKEGQSLHYFGRAACSSPATGFASVHREEQKRIVENALDPHCVAPGSDFYCELWS